VSGGDPLLLAGHMSCRRCGAIGWPEDATWLADDLIVAVYLPGCVHIKELTRITRPSELQPDSRCMGTCASGARCGRRTVRGAWCAQHVPDREARQ